SMPETIQTSPLSVQTAARPSAKKSKPLVFIRGDSGSGSVSTANASTGAPILPSPICGFVHCAGPPKQERFKSSGGDGASEAANLSNSFCAPVQIAILKLTAFWIGGIFNEIAVP